MRYKGPVCIARIKKPYDKNGEVLVFSETENPDSILKYKEIFILYKGEKRKLKVESVKKRGGRRFIIKFKEIDSLEKANSMRNLNIYVDRKDLIETKEKENFYVFDLENMSVQNFESKEEIGFLLSIQKGAEYDFFIIKEKNGDEIVLPGTEKFIKKIDLHNSVIYVDLSSFENVKD